MKPPIIMGRRRCSGFIFWREDCRFTYLSRVERQRNIPVVIPSPVFDALARK